MMNGLFIVLEGADGVGKTTQCQRLVDRLVASGFPTLRTREPTCRPAGKRALLFARRGDPSARTWFERDRAAHLEEEILPALSDGCLVVCDRYHFSTMVYQVDLTEVGPYIERHRHELGLREPDLVLVLALPKASMDERCALGLIRADPEEGALSRGHLHAYRNAYFRRLGEQLDYARIIAADGSVEEVHQRVWAEVSAAIEENDGR